MRKLTLSLALAAMLVGVVPAHAANETSTKCADIVNGTGNYSQPGVTDPISQVFVATGPATMAFNMTTADPSCPSASYTLELSNDTGAVVYASQTRAGNGTTSVTFSIELPDTGSGTTGPSSVCAVGTTFDSRGRLIDRAPDSGFSQCWSLNGSGGSSGFR